MNNLVLEGNGMESFPTAGRLHVEVKRFLDAYNAAMLPLSREFSIPQTAAEILLFLANNPENCTAKEICALRHLKPGIVSLHVDTLVTLGLLERQSVPGDRRKLRLVPTQKAQPLIVRGREMQEEFAKTLAQGLGPDDLACFMRCLETISQNLEYAAQSV